MPPALARPGENASARATLSPLKKKDDTLEDMEARVKAARKKRHKAKTVSGNIKRVTAIIIWLVQKSRTQALTCNSHHEHRVKVGSTYYWVDWSKLPLLGDHVCLFLTSKWRKLPNGTLIPESYDTLAKYRSSVAHFRAKSCLEGISIVYSVNRNNKSL